MGSDERSMFLLVFNSCYLLSPPLFSLSLSLLSLKDEIDPAQLREKLETLK